MAERELKDKVVVVTGGAGGIGFGVADNFLKSGAKTVIILDISQEQGDKSVAALTAKHGANRAFFIKCDVTKDLEIVSEKIFNEYKTVDVLVNNAGISNEADWKRTIDINVAATIGWSFKFMDHMRKDVGGKGGTIVNISSVYGFVAGPYVSTYNASKFAVLGFTRSLGHLSNYSRTGVRVIAVCPGFTKTGLGSSSLGKTWDVRGDQLEAEFLQFMATQLWQDADGVGAAAVDTFERADSGTAWSVIGGKPIQPVPSTVNESKLYNENKVA